MFEVGQEVICKIYGEGVVSSVIEDKNEIYPVEVDFLNDEWECYTKDGRKYSDDVEPSLSLIGE